MFWYFFGFLHLSWFIVFFFTFFLYFQEDIAIFHEGNFTWNCAIGSNSVYQVKLLRIDQEFPCIFVANWTFPASISGCHHERQKCFQVETLAVLAFVAPDWGFDEIPGVRIIYTHWDPVYFHFFLRCFHEFLNKVSNFRQFLFFDNFLIEFINIEFFNEVDAKGKGIVISNFLVADIFFGEMFDFKAEFYFLKSSFVALSIFIVIDILSDNDGVIFSFFKGGVHLKCRDLYNSLTVEFNDALVRPGDLIVVKVGYLETPHFYLIFVLLFAEVLVGFQVAGYGEFIVNNIGDVLLSDNLFDLVERIDKPHSAMIALYSFFHFDFLVGFIETIEMKLFVANWA